MTQTENQNIQMSTLSTSSEPKCSLDKSDSLTQTEKILQGCKNKMPNFGDGSHTCGTRAVNPKNGTLYCYVCKAQAQTLLEAKKEEVEWLSQDTIRNENETYSGQKLEIEERISSLKSEIKLLEGATK